LVDLFEKKFVDKFFPNQAIFSFWKGRVALYAILKALEIGEDDEIILPGYTCVVVPNAIRFTRAKMRFIDNIPGTYHINPEQIESNISKKTRAIIIQHTYGIPGPVEEIKAISEKHNIPVIEDCAHSLGSSFNGTLVGNWGLAAFFSSQWSKPFTTGLGGLAVTSDPEFGRKIEKISNGMTEAASSARWKLNLQYFIYKKFYSPRVYWQAQKMLHVLSKMGLFVGSSTESELEGNDPLDHNWRMSFQQKKDGYKSLVAIEENFKHREQLVKFYDEVLEKNGWPTAYRTGKTNFLRYPILVRNKEELLLKARQDRVELGSWFETPLHPAPMDKHYIFGYWLGQCPVAEETTRQVVNLPLHQWITFKEADNIIKFFIRNAKKIK
jgi:dTDP-4-amino-4,6-dideoxygalactose transaminase